MRIRNVTLVLTTILASWIVVPFSVSGAPSEEIVKASTGPVTTSFEFNAAGTAVLIKNDSDLPVSLNPRDVSFKTRAGEKAPCTIHDVSMFGYPYAPRIAYTSLTFKGSFCPKSLPLFHGTRAVVSRIPNVPVV